VPDIVEGESGSAEEEAKRLLWQIDGAECPVCGGREWQRLGPLGNLLVTIPAATPHGEPVASKEEMATLAAFPFNCKACGFVRLHARHTLIKLAVQARVEPPP